MLNFLTIKPLASLTFLLATTSPNDTPPTKVLRVCTSPGCKDDGAISTLNRLHAMAPPCLRVVKGGCTSLCGSGPIVEICNNIDDVQSVKRKRVKDEALVGLLDEFMDSDEKETVFTPFMRDRLLEGYEFYIQANEAYNLKQYQSAIELYEEAIQNGRKPAMALQEAREKYSITVEKGESQDFPKGLNWIVETFRNSCRSRLAVGDIDGARRDAFAATVFSQNNDAASHECLADVCNRSDDALGEYQAVKASIAQYEKVEEKYSKPMPGKDAVARAEAAKIRNDAASRKRELGFRLAKLERKLKES